RPEESARVMTISGARYYPLALRSMRCTCTACQRPPLRRRNAALVHRLCYPRRARDSLRPDGLDDVQEVGAPRGGLPGDHRHDADGEPVRTVVPLGKHYLLSPEAAPG
ncbi:MAG: hypothetical protein WCA23_33025, partial [Stellaceae bacterium]